MSELEFSEHAERLTLLSSTTYMALRVHGGRRTAKMLDKREACFKSVTRNAHP